MATINMHKKKIRFVHIYLHIHSLFHRISVYSDSDMSSIHIQEHSRHRSCRDRFHMETENKYLIWSQHDLINAADRYSQTIQDCIDELIIWILNPLVVSRMQ